MAKNFTVAQKIAITRLIQIQVNEAKKHWGRDFDLGEKVILRIVANTIMNLPTEDDVDIKPQSLWRRLLGG